jgi:two-component system, sporulation sensor kinase E
MRRRELRQSRSTRPPPRNSGFSQKKPESAMAEIEQAEMLEISRAILERSAEGVFICDFTGKFLNANPVALNLLGLTHEELLGRSISDVIPQGQLQKAVGSLREIIENGSQSEIQRYMLLSKSGEQHHVAARASLLMRDGKPHAILGIVRDVTDFMNMQDELRRTTALAAAGKVARKAGHDIRSFLAPAKSLTSYLETIDPDKLTPERIATMKKIAKSAAESLQKVDSILAELMLISAPGLKNVDNVDVNPILNVLADSIQASLVGKAEVFDIKLELCDSLHLVVGERLMLDRAFYNIIVNALEAMPGGGQLSIKTENTGHGGEPFVRITFEDTGHGMEPEVMDKIFNPEFTTKGEKGTGIGLVITSQAVVHHQGWIDVSSEPGLGTKFEIYIPAATPA